MLLKSTFSLNSSSEFAGKEFYINFIIKVKYIYIYIYNFNSTD